MNLRVSSPSGVIALACGVLFLIAIWPVCGCVPTDYREVEPASIPEVLRADAGRIEPGIRPERAWAFWIGGRRPGRDADGYLIRGRISGSWWNKDIKVHAHHPDPGTVDLRPID